MLQRRATVVITDSGGIQEQSTFLNVPCLTMRENTERPVTIKLGTKQRLGRDLDLLRTEILKIAAGQRKVAKPFPLWDGRAAGRIADFLCEPVHGSASAQCELSSLLNTAAPSITFLSPMRLE